MNHDPLADAHCATLSRQHFRCRTCDRPFQQFIGMNLPGNMVMKQMTAIRCPYCGGKKIGLGEGRTLAEDRAMRTSLTGTPDLRAGLWLAEGETGTSSATIAHFMLGRIDGFAEVSAPRDLDDLRRCLLLLDRIPEWAERMPEMADVPGWERLAPAWANLSASYLRERPDLDGPAPEPKDLLDALG